jgi:hypothetical protein
MYAARGPARPQAGHGAAHNRTHTPSHGVTHPRRPDYRRAVTRVKDACGAGQAGRAEARSLTRASRAHEQAAARERDTRGQLTMPANRSADAKLQAEPRLTPTRSFRDVRAHLVVLTITGSLRAQTALTVILLGFNNGRAGRTVKQVHRELVLDFADPGGIGGTSTGSSLPRSPGPWRP